jgi:hypothetical protein
MADEVWEDIATALSTIVYNGQKRKYEKGIEEHHFRNGEYAQETII